jgi:hypothetical protein
MRKLTPQDLNGPNTIASIEFCDFFDKELDHDNEDDDIVLRVYQGGKGHTCIIGMHNRCYIMREKQWEWLDNLGKTGILGNVVGKVKKLLGRK